MVQGEDWDNKLSAGVAFTGQEDGTSDSVSLTPFLRSYHFRREVAVASITLTGEMLRSFSS